MTKKQQAEIQLRNAGYSIRYNHYKGKAYPHIEKGDEKHTDSNLIKLCKKVLPHIELK